MEANYKVCNTCKHFSSKGENYVCPAFPKGIPMMFLSADMEHTAVIEGQTGSTIWQKRG